jgi:hypothetical protein
MLQTRALLERGNGRAALRCGGARDRRHEESFDPALSQPPGLPQQRIVGAVGAASCRPVDMA